LKQESKDIPARKELIQSRLAEHKEALHTVQEDKKKKNLGIKEIEGEVEACQHKIGRFRTQQFEVKTNKEYRALENEIKAEEEKIAALEERELGIMEELDTLRAEIRRREAELKEEDALVQQDLQNLEKRKENIELEINQLKTDRENLAGETDPDWLAQYERIMNNKQDFGLVSVENKTCGGCHMKVPPQTYQDARSGLKMVFCDYCGRMLYAGPQ
jgi:predicted  nucleic acid-binding Zn-ribbon protein